MVSTWAIFKAHGILGLMHACQQHMFTVEGYWFCCVGWSQTLLEKIVLMVSGDPTVTPPSHTHNARPPLAHGVGKGSLVGAFCHCGSSLLIAMRVFEAIHGVQSNQKIPNPEDRAFWGLSECKIWPPLFSFPLNFYVINLHFTRHHPPSLGQEPKHQARALLSLPHLACACRCLPKEVFIEADLALYYL